MVNFLSVFLHIEELGETADLLVVHVMKASLHDLINEVHNAGKVLLLQMLGLLVERESLQRADAYLIAFALRVGSLERGCGVHASRREDCLRVSNVLPVDASELISERG